jgi:hypothetical protein
VTSFMIQQLAAPSSARDARALDAASSRAMEELSGRTVWCATALPGGRGAADTLRASLQSSGEGVAAEWLEMEAGEPLRGVAQRLDAMLAGTTRTAAELGPGDREIYAEGGQEGDLLVGPGVAGDDVVVLHDPLTAVLAQAARERGAHVVWHLQAGAASPAEGEAWAFMEPYTPTFDAFVMTWQQPLSHGRTAERIAALMPSADLLAASEIALTTPEEALERRHNLGWSSVLADVVHADRDERVGGTRHPRPAVPGR